MTNKFNEVTRNIRVINVSKAEENINKEKQWNFEMVVGNYAD